MKTSLFCPLLLLLSLVLNSAFAEDQKSIPSAPQKIVIGAILPLTGNGVSAGESIQNGMKLAFDDLPPEVRSRIEIIFEDDQMLPRFSVNAFQMMQGKRNLVALVNFGANTGNSLAPLAEKIKLPFLSVSSDRTTAEGRSFVFSVWITPESVAALSLEETKKRGYKRAARITSIHAGRLFVKKELDRQNDDRLIFILDEEYPLEERDFRTFLLKLRQLKNLDCIIVNLHLGQVGLFARQAREVGIETPLIGFEYHGDSREVEVSKGALNGQWYVSVSDGGDKFLRRYHERFPESSDHAAAVGYDMFGLLANAISKGASDRESINTALHQVKLQGVTGSLSADTFHRFNVSGEIKVVP